MESRWGREITSSGIVCRPEGFKHLISHLNSAAQRDPLLLKRHMKWSVLFFFFEQKEQSMGSFRSCLRCTVYFTGNDCREELWKYLSLCDKWNWRMKSRYGRFMLEQFFRWSTIFIRAIKATCMDDVNMYICFFMHKPFIIIFNLKIIIHIILITCFISDGARKKCKLILLK